MTEEIRTGKARLLLDMFDGYSSPPLESVFFTTRDFARKHPEAVARFANVVRRKYTNAHAVETLPLFIQLSGMNPHRKSDPPFAHAGLVQRSPNSTGDRTRRQIQGHPASFDARELLAQ